MEETSQLQRPTENADEKLPAREEQDDDSDEATLAREVLSAEERNAKRLARKPDVSRLSPGIGQDGLPLFDKGSRVVVERRISFIHGNPWLDTHVYTVLHLDLSSGIVQALDEEHGHRSFLSFKDGFHDFYLCPKKGNPLAKQRRRPFVTG